MISLDVNTTYISTFYNLKYFMQTVNDGVNKTINNYLARGSFILDDGESIGQFSASKTNEIEITVNGYVGETF